MLKVDCLDSADKFTVIRASESKRTVAFFFSQLDDNSVYRLLPQTACPREHLSPLVRNRADLSLCVH